MLIRTWGGGSFKCQGLSTALHSLPFCTLLCRCGRTQPPRPLQGVRGTGLGAQARGGLPPHWPLPGVVAQTSLSPASGSCILWPQLIAKSRHCPGHLTDEHGRLSPNYQGLAMAQRDLEARVGRSIELYAPLGTVT